MRMEAAVQGREEGAREGKGLVNTRRLLLTLVSIQPLFGWTGSTCNRETTTLEWKIVILEKTKYLNYRGTNIMQSFSGIGHFVSSQILSFQDGCAFNVKL